MIYVIAGQTASGKSGLGLEFAKKIGGAIINGDAFQVYRKLDIGTAKPSLDERKEVPHYLFDIVDVDHAFSIFEYQKKARAIIDDLVAKNIPVVIIGGSGLYLRSILFDYQFAASTPVSMDNFETKSDDELHDYLNQIDPLSAEKIHPHNRRRVLRAIEIYLQTGQQKSSLEQAQNPESHYPYVMVALNPDKEVLHQNIFKRVEVMFAQGLRSEVTHLLKEFDSNSPGFKAIGYKEFIVNPQLNDQELIELIAKNTRKYAKRQMTFFKNQFDIQFFPNRDEALAFLLTKHEERHHEND